MASLLFYRIGKKEPEILEENKTIQYCKMKRACYKLLADYESTKGYFKIPGEYPAKVKHQEISEQHKWLNEH